MTEGAARRIIVGVGLIVAAIAAVVWALFTGRPARVGEAVDLEKTYREAEKEAKKAEEESRAEIAGADPERLIDERGMGADRDAAVDRLGQGFGERVRDRARGAIFGLFGRPRP